MKCIYGQCNGRNCLDCEEAEDRRSATGNPPPCETSSKYNYGRSGNPPPSAPESKYN